MVDIAVAAINDAEDWLETAKAAISIKKIHKGRLLSEDIS